MKNRWTYVFLAVLMGSVLASAGTIISYSGWGDPGNGASVHGVTAWHQAGYTGLGVKIGVIDVGFRGIQDLLGSELPETITAMCPGVEHGDTSYSIQDCEVLTPHGTAVAETVMNIAPDASLYIASVNGLALSEIVAWMISEGVTVINHSVIWGSRASGDGIPLFTNSPMAAINQAVAGGAIWINGAGNDARHTWYSDGPTYVSAGNDAYNFVEFLPGEITQDIHMPEDGYIGPYLRWQEDQWNRASRDLDILVWDYQRKVLIPAGASPQRGRRGDIPMENFTIPVPAGKYGFIIAHRKSTLAPGWMQFMNASSALEHPSPFGHMSPPAESRNPGMMAVGAARWDKTDSISSYSSRGPAPDGRLKPEIVASDCDRTVHYRLMCGTSQAAPHVAGMAALVKQRFPGYSPVQIAEYLKAHAQQPATATSDPNYDWGHGFAMMPTPAPTPTPTPTPEPTPTPAPTPTPTLTGDPLIDRYDLNRDGAIQKDEVIAAINDYLFNGQDAPTKEQVIRLINLYLFGQ